MYGGDLYGDGVGFGDSSYDNGYAGGASYDDSYLADGGYPVDNGMGYLDEGLGYGDGGGLGYAGDTGFGYGDGGGLGYGDGGGGFGYTDDIGLGYAGGGGLGYGGVGGMGYGGAGGLGYADNGGGFGSDYLYGEMAFMDHEMPLLDAWGDGGGWADEQWALSDLMNYQRELEMDRELDEQERLRRWEERLRWEELDEAERMRRYRAMDGYSLQRLGISGGWWGRRFGGRNDLDLGYLRNVNLQRGLFSSPFRNVFSRYSGLRSRYTPYFTSSVRGYGAGRMGTAGFGRLGGGMRAYGGGMRGVGGGLGGLGGLGGVSYASRSLAGSGPNLRLEGLRTRLRIAETRAAMTSLPPEQRARAADDVRSIKQQMTDELRVAHSFDREERREDAVVLARETREQQLELRRDLQQDRANIRILETSGSGAGAYGGRYGGMGGVPGMGLGRRPLNAGMIGYGGGVGNGMMLGRRRSLGRRGVYGAY